MLNIKETEPAKKSLPTKKYSSNTPAFDLGFHAKSDYQQQDLTGGINV